jgi:MFS-type transporter involved in bile tolerance (Atg22 family)
VLTFFGLVMAMVIQPISGALSDGWVSAWGRRRPLMLIGIAGDFVFLAVRALADSLAGLAVGYIGLQFCSNIAQGPAQGLLRDRVPSAQMGAASGVKNFMDMLGLVLASLGMGRLIAPDTVSAALPAAVIAAVLALTALATLGGVHESPVARPRRTPPASPASAGEPSLPAPAPPGRVSRAYFWLIAARFAFLLGLYLIQSFAQ